MMVALEELPKDKIFTCDYCETRQAIYEEWSIGRMEVVLGRICQECVNIIYGEEN